MCAEWIDTTIFTLRTGCHRAADLPFSPALDMAVERARGCRLHALLNGDFGQAITAELA